MKNKIIIISFFSICLISGIILSKVYIKNTSLKKDEILKSNDKNKPDKQAVKKPNNNLKNASNKNNNSNKSNFKKSKSEVNEKRIKFINIDKNLCMQKESTIDEILEYYDKNGFDINDSIRSNFQYTIFEYLLGFNPEAAKELLATGLVDSSRAPSALQTAVLIRKDYELIKQMLDYGFDPNTSPSHGFKPYIAAVTQGLDDVCELLYSKGAAATEKFKNKDALNFALSRRDTNSKSLDILLSHGLEINGSHLISATQGSVEKIDYVLDKKPDLINIKKDGKDILGIAISEGNLESVKYFIGKGFEITKSHYEISKIRSEKKTIRSSFGDFVSEGSIRIHEFIKSKFEETGSI